MGGAEGEGGGGWFAEGGHGMEQVFVFQDF